MMCEKCNNYKKDLVKMTELADYFRRESDFHSMLFLLTCIISAAIVLAEYFR